MQDGQRWRQDGPIRGEVRLLKLAWAKSVWEMIGILRMEAAPESLVRDSGQAWPAVRAGHGLVRECRDDDQVKLRLGDEFVLSFCR